VSRIAAVPVPRPLLATDRARVEAMTRASPLFRPEEVLVALDVFDAATGNGRRRDPDYYTAGADADGVLVGWVCWGPTPCTIGTYDMYWIVVDPPWQGKGIGKRLVEYSEEVSRSEDFVKMVLHAREIVVPFYLKLGYAIEGEPFEEVTIPHCKMVKDL